VNSPATAQGAHGDQSPGSASLAVEDLVAGYGGVLALDRVTITADAATITAVLGANGAGKTTLLRAISGMVRPRGGRVVLDGVDRAGRSPEDMARAGIAHVPEGQGVIAELTVEENLRIGTMSWPGIAWRRAERAAALAEAYDRFSCSRTAAAGWPPPCPAASGRCSSSHAHSWPARACCCSMSRPSASRRGS
jgi:ABC-type branched-subunit amino acid transport system ATPase component